MSVCHFEVCLINRAGGGYSYVNNKTLFTFQKCQVLLFVFLGKEENLKRAAGKGEGVKEDRRRTGFGKEYNFSFCRL